jgi:hypothetical protein
LLLKDQDGLPVWRTLGARVLMGWGDANKTAKGKLVAYRFDDCNSQEPNAPKTNVLDVCDSWRALESTAPTNIFEELWGFRSC